MLPRDYVDPDTLPRRTAAPFDARTWAFRWYATTYFLFVALVVVYVVTSLCGCEKRTEIDRDPEVGHARMVALTFHGRLIAVRDPETGATIYQSATGVAVLPADAHRKEKP